MEEIIAAIVGAVIGGGIQYTITIIQNGNEQESLIDRIDNSAFEIFSDSTTPEGVWEEYRRDWKAYNDSWVMELKSPEDYIESHRKRYRDPACGRFKFLFFTKNSPQQFTRFVKFQAMVHLGLKPEVIHSDGFDSILSSRLKMGDLPKSLEHICVYLNDKVLPKQTFFRGYKAVPGSDDLQKVSIWYLSLDSSESSPHLILKTTDTRFWKDLDDKWNEMRVGAEKIHGEKIFDKYLEISSENSTI